MYNYIKSELYRLIRQKECYFFIVISSLLLLSSNIVLALCRNTDNTFRYATTKFSFGLICGCFMILYILCTWVGSIAFGNEYTHHTMKNSISYGISREILFFGKLIVEILYAVFAFVIILGIYIGSSYLLLENSGSQHLMAMLEMASACLPFFLFVLAVTNSFSFIIEGSGGAIAAICGLIIAFPAVSNMLAMKFEVFRQIGKILPYNLISKIGYDFVNQTLRLYWKTNGYLYYWIDGIVQMLIITIIGYAIFRKKEIK